MLPNTTRYELRNPSMATPAPSTYAALKPVPAKLSTGYNLEKAPLQTGRKLPDVSLRTQVVSALQEYYRGRLLAGGFLLELIVLTIAGGLVGLWFAVEVFEQYVAAYWA
jgi:hypothetical protein